jgi:hypothetical protein
MPVWLQLFLALRRRRTRPVKPKKPIPAKVKLDGSGAAEKVPDPCAVKLPIVASEPVPTMPSAGLTLEKVNDAPLGVPTGRDGE